MSLVTNRAGRKHVTLFASLLLTLALALGASRASAETFEGKLGAGEWSCGKCRVEPLTFIEAEVVSERNGRICIGPVQYSGGKYQFPYGWYCSNYSAAAWPFSELDASEGIENPNSYAIRYKGEAH